MNRDTTNVEPEMYDCTSSNWSHWNSNKKLKEKFGHCTRKTFDRFTTKDSYTWTITHNMESTAVWSLKPERCDKRHPYCVTTTTTTTTIIIIISRSFTYWTILKKESSTAHLMFYPVSYVALLTSHLTGSNCHCRIPAVCSWKVCILPVIFCVILEEVRKQTLIMVNRSVL